MTRAKALCRLVSNGNLPEIINNNYTTEEINELVSWAFWGDPPSFLGTYNALMIAASYRHLDIIEYFIDVKRADPSIMGGYNRDYTALDCAKHKWWFGPSVNSDVVMYLENCNISLKTFAHPNDPPVIKVNADEVFLFPGGRLAVLKGVSVKLLKHDQSDLVSEEIYTEYARITDKEERCRKTKHSHYGYTHYNTPLSLAAFDDKTLLVMYEDDDLRNPYLLVKSCNMEEEDGQPIELEKGYAYRSRGGQAIYSEQKFFIATMHPSEGTSKIICRTSDATLWTNYDGTGYWRHLCLISNIDRHDGYLVATSTDKLITVIDTETGHTVAQLNSPTVINAICDLGNGIIATGGSDGIFWSTINDIFIWDIHSQEIVKTLSGHQNRIISICKLQDNYLVSSSEDNTIRIWDCNNSECIMTFKYASKMQLRICDGNTLHVFGNNELHRFNALWLLSQVLLNTQELKVAKEILLNFSLSDSDRFALFDSAYISLSEQGFSDSVAFLETFELCYNPHVDYNLSSGEQKLFDARLSGACNIPFYVGDSIDASTRARYLEQVKLMVEPPELLRTTSSLESNGFFAPQIQEHKEADLTVRNGLAFTK